MWHDWTPEQVDALPDYYRQRLPVYHQIRQQMAEEEKARQEYQQRKGGR